MERSGFFGSVNGDRRYRSKHWAAYFANFIGNGVYARPSSQLQVIAVEGMRIAVRPGAAFINGYDYDNSENRVFQLANADGVLSRIDRIVLRWSLIDRGIWLHVKSSAFASSPVAPMVERNPDVFELAIADVRVGNGVTTITQSMITDQRLDSSICGMVAAVVNQIDTEAFNAQLQAWFAEMKLASAEDLEDFRRLLRDLYEAGVGKLGDFQSSLSRLEATATQEARELLELIRGILGEEAAGHILGLIFDINRLMPLVSSLEPQSQAAGALWLDVSASDEEHIAATGNTYEQLEEFSYEELEEYTYNQLQKVRITENG